MTKTNQKIPEGWSVKKLGDIGKICMCKRIFKEQTHNYGDVPFYKIGTFGEKADAFISWELFTEYKQKYSYPKIGDILISCSGTIGRTVIFNGQPSYFQDSNIVWINNNENILLNQYLFYLYSIIKWRSTESSTIARLYNDNIKNTKIYFPPLPEQEKIAEILSCWDEGIEKLSALIEKKKLQKKALMQQLLTGKHRIKGFSTPWNEVKLEDVLYEHKETSKGDETICSVSVHKGIISQIEHLGRCFAASNTSNYNLVHYGDVVYTKSPTGEFPYGIFKQSQQRKSVIVSPLYGVFTPKTYYLGYILDVFFSYAINLNNYLKPIIQKGAKNTINITNETFLSKVIFLPEETKEIKKLAEIFIKSDEEIELLNKKLEAFKLEKKALMQKLLTGQIRVKVN